MEKFIESKTEKGTKLLEMQQIHTVEEMTLAKEYELFFRKTPPFHRTIFFLDSPYIACGDNYGWQSEEDKKLFQEAVFKVFSEAGWTIEYADGSCLTAKKDKKAYLYIHPIQFSGEVRKDIIPEIEDLIAKINGFNLREIKVFERTYPFFSKSQLLRFMRENRELLYWWIILRFENKVDDYNSDHVVFELVNKIQFFEHPVPQMWIRQIAEQRMVDMFYTLVDVGDIKLLKNNGRPCYQAKHSKWKLVKDRT